MIKQQIKEIANQQRDKIIQIRRHLHQHPELSFQEEQTGKYIAARLAEFGIPHEHGWAEHGVVGMIEGKNTSSRVLALRADIDALPILEANAVSYKSRHDGIMHACGHDVHTASLLGAANILNQLKEHFEGSIKLIFQPGEERLPGGASLLIKEGVLKNPAPNAILGQHVHPPLECGKVGFKPGMYMASADELFLTVKGKGGHGALPHKCIDPVLISAHIITALQQIVSRYGDPIVPAVVTFGRINTVGGALNIIPNEVKLEGTFRTMDEKWRFEAHDRMQRLVNGIAESMGGSADFEIKVGYPFLHNNEQLTLNSKSHAIEYLGEKNVVELPIRMTAEDFSYYSQEMPACFYRLGTGNKARGITSQVHTDTFDVDEDCLELGPGLMAWLAVKQLGN